MSNPSQVTLTSLRTVRRIVKELELPSIYFSSIFSLPSFTSVPSLWQKSADFSHNEANEAKSVQILIFKKIFAQRSVLCRTNGYFPSSFLFKTWLLRGYSTNETRVIWIVLGCILCTASKHKIQPFHLVEYPPTVSNWSLIISMSGLRYSQLRIILFWLSLFFGSSSVGALPRSSFALSTCRLWLCNVHSTTRL